MRSRNKIILVAAGLAVTAVLGAILYQPQVGIKSQNRPNVVLITINILRADHVSAYGYSRKTTPAIDALAQESYVFKNAFAHDGYTMPSMMSILTSHYPDSHQVYDAYKDELSERVPTLAEILKLHGYRTAWFAKLDLGHLLPRAGFGRGMDYMSELGFQLEGKEKLFKWVKKRSRNPFFVAMNIRHTHSPYIPLPEYLNVFTKGLKRLPIETYEQYSEAVYNNFMQKVREPGSSIYNLIDPELISSRPGVFRGGYRPGKLEKIYALIKTEEQYKMGSFKDETYFDLVDPANKEDREAMIANYDSCILGVDQEIVRPILDILREKGVYGNTLVIVTGDHGESLGEHDIVGHGFMFYEQFVHVPLIIKMPGEKQGRSEIQGMVQGIDIMPTILEKVGIDVPGKLQGKSLIPMLDKPSLEVNGYIFGENRHNAYIRSKKWKLVVNRFHKLRAHPEDLFFDLKNDPGELNDVKDDHPETYLQYLALLREHLEGLPKFIDKQYEFYPDIDAAIREKIKNTGYW